MRLWILLKMLCSKVLAIFNLLLPSSLLDELSIDERDSDGFISRRSVCRSRNSSYNSIDSSLVTVGYQLRYLALLYTRAAN